MIFFLGAPGSGKGTQTRLLSKEIDYPIFCVGDALRQEAAKGTQLGLEIKKIIEAGQYVSPELVVELMLHNLTNRLIVDGFPRNLQQALLFEEISSQDKFVQKGLKIDLVINLVVDFEKLRARLVNRKNCAACDASLLDDQVECSFCEESSQDFYYRADDKKEIIEKRLNLFKKEQEELVKFYADKDYYECIDASKTISEVFEAISSCVIARNLLK